jgi:hypothetical protein
MAAKYFDLSNLPSVPDSFDFSPLGGSTMTDILGNSELGDCTAAGVAHLIALLSGSGGAPAVITAAETINFYSLSTGYVIGDPSTDQGGDEVSVLTYWANHGFDGQGAHKIAGSMVVDPSNPALLKACAYYFGNLYFGLEIAKGASEAPGFVWGPGTPNPLAGHCVVGTGGTLTGIPVDSWGEKGELTYEGIADLCSEANGGMVFCVLSEEWVAKAAAAAPNGLDLAALVADFDQLGGAVSA